MMNFKHAEERFKQLENQFTTGQLSETDLKSQLKELMFQDNKGSWWIIGYETKKWYRYNGQEWIRANPRAEQYFTYGIIALVIIFVLISVWGAISFLGKFNTNGVPSPTSIPGQAGPTGLPREPGPAGASSESNCAGCHNNAGIIAVKHDGWEATAHGNGITYTENFNNKSCAFCHAGRVFNVAIAVGQNYSQLEAGAIEPSRQDCYTCHQIHTTYTVADWALETETPVTLVISGVTFDGGSGNLCANCHQARRYMTYFVDKNNTTKFVATIRFDAHYSAQSDILMGLVDVGDALGVEGKPAAHYSMVEDTCVGCHLGDGKDHTFTPQVTTCVKCHTDASSFDINGFQAIFEEKFKTLEEVLLAKGLIEDLDGYYYAVPGTYDTPTAGAIFTYFLIAKDGSMGVHNPNYLGALIDSALQVLE